MSKITVYDIKKNNFYKRMFKFVFILIFVVFSIVCFWYIENFSIEINNTAIISDKIKGEIKIIHISDLHGQEFGRNNIKLLKKIGKINPDIILVTGDMYTRNDSKGMKNAISFMKSLKTPTYFVPGEHDVDTSVNFLNILEESGIHILDYKDIVTEINDNLVHIYGIDNATFSPTYNLSNAFEKPSDDSLNILLSHVPKFDLFLNWGPDIVFSGDTHGGIMQIPFVGPLYYDNEWLPKLKKISSIYDKGLFKIGDMYGYVSGGLGSYPYPLRIFNRPEISVITIKSSN